MSHYIVGANIGQSIDPPAIAVLGVDAVGCVAEAYGGPGSAAPQTMDWYQSGGGMIEDPQRATHEEIG